MVQVHRSSLSAAKYLSSSQSEKQINTDKQEVTGHETPLMLLSLFRKKIAQEDTYIGYDVGRKPDKHKKESQGDSQPGLLLYRL